MTWTRLDCQFSRTRHSYGTFNNDLQLSFLEPRYAFGFLLHYGWSLAGCHLTHLTRHHRSAPDFSPHLSFHLLSLGNELVTLYVQYLPPESVIKRYAWRFTRALCVRHPSHQEGRGRELLDEILCGTCMSLFCLMFPYRAYITDLSYDRRV